VATVQKEGGNDKSKSKKEKGGEKVKKKEK
jgi:hypothetical protein